MTLRLITGISVLVAGVIYHTPPLCGNSLHLNQYSPIKLAHQVQVGTRKITLEQIAMDIRGTEQIQGQGPAKPRM